MSANNEKFLDIIENAEQIIGTLEKLQEEIESYDAAGKKLDDVRKELKVFVASAKEASDGMLQLSKTLDGKIDNLSKNTSNINKSIDQSQQMIANKIQTNNETLKANMTKLADFNNELIKELDVKLNLLKVALFVAVALSVISLVVGIIF